MNKRQQLTISSNTSPSMPVSALQALFAKPTATSNKMSYPSTSQGPKEEKSLSKRNPMEVELNQSSGSRPQSTIVQERKVESIKDSKAPQVIKNSNQGKLPSQHGQSTHVTSMQIERSADPRRENTRTQAFEEAKLENTWTALNNGAQASQSDILVVNAKLQASLEEADMRDIKEKFFAKDQCLLCGKFISRDFRAHIKMHVQGRKNMKNYYSLCLKDKSLQVKCLECPRIFDQLTVTKLQEHSQTCNSNKELLKSIVKNRVERMRAKKVEDKNKAMEDELTALKKQVNEIYKVQQTMKEEQDSTDKRVADGEKDLIAVKEKVENNEKRLVGAIQDLTNAITVLNKQNESKEKERERERSRERARNGSHERRTTRQGSRWTREERERSEERRYRRRDNSSEERSQDKRRTRYDKGSSRRH